MIRNFQTKSRFQISLHSWLNLVYTSFSCFSHVLLILKLFNAPLEKGKEPFRYFDFGNVENGLLMKIRLFCDLLQLRVELFRAESVGVGVRDVIRIFIYFLDEKTLKILRPFLTNRWSGSRPGRIWQRNILQTNFQIPKSYGFRVTRSDFLQISRSFFNVPSFEIGNS